MDISKSLDEGILTLALSGDFDTTETDWFSAEISEAIDADHLRVHMDLSELAFINSTALGTLLRSQKRLAQYGGGLVASGTSPDVARTFHILQLDRRILLFDDAEAAAAHLKELQPESVAGTGESVMFLVEDSEEVFGERPRRAKLEEINETGLSLAFENLEALDPDAAFVAGSVVRLEFRLPLYHPSHIFKARATVSRFEPLGRESLLLRLEFTELEDAEREAIRQYVKDLRFLRDES